MTRRLTLLLAALEAVFLIAIGVAIPLVPLTIVWATHFGFGPDWLIFWRAAADVWLIGHGVDVSVPTFLAARISSGWASQTWSWLSRPRLYSLMRCWRASR